MTANIFCLISWLRWFCMNNISHLYGSADYKTVVILCPWMVAAQVHPFMPVASFHEVCKLSCKCILSMCPVSFHVRPALWKDWLATPGFLITKCLWAHNPKLKNMCCLYMKSNHQIRSQICTHHNMCKLIWWMNWLWYESCQTSMGWVLIFGVDNTADAAEQSQGQYLIYIWLCW